MGTLVLTLLLPHHSFQASCWDCREAAEGRLSASSLPSAGNPWLLFPAPKLADSSGQLVHLLDEGPAAVPGCPWCCTCFFLLGWPCWRTGKSNSQETNLCSCRAPEHSQPGREPERAIPRPLFQTLRVLSSCSPSFSTISVSASPLPCTPVFLCTLSFPRAFSSSYCPEYSPLSFTLTTPLPVCSSSLHPSIQPSLHASNILNPSFYFDTPLSALPLFPSYL